MLPEISKIKQRRLSLGIKQKELATLAKVSQSLIAKLESNRIECSYNIVKNIFSVLDSLEHKKEKICEQVMSVPLIFVRKDDSLEKALDLMKKNNISQVPVINNKMCIGSISETLILDKLIEGQSIKNLSNLKVFDVMQESFPIVRKDMPLSIVLPLLKGSEAILVSDKSHLIGIITKANLI